IAEKSVQSTKGADKSEAEPPLSLFR
ncbi:hypothetical protein CCACVL1_29528, partial [Corchorus capsularis]